MLLLRLPTGALARRPRRIAGQRVLLPRGARGCPRGCTTWHGLNHFRRTWPGIRRLPAARHWIEVITQNGLADLLQAKSRVGSPSLGTRWPRVTTLNLPTGVHHIRSGSVNGPSCSCLTRQGFCTALHLRVPEPTRHVTCSSELRAPLMRPTPPLQCSGLAGGSLVHWWCRGAAAHGPPPPGSRWRLAAVHVAAAFQCPRRGSVLTARGEVQLACFWAVRLPKCLLPLRQPEHAAAR